MARLPRFVLPGHPQHVIQRGNNRQVIFCAESDYQFYLEKLLDAAREHACDIHAYVLMTNHVHLLVTPHEENSISKMMQSLGRRYVQYFNYMYKRTGTLWEGRYKASLIDTDRYLFTCMRYIELNPVRARDMVEHPSEYPWSSYRHNAMGKLDKLITEHPLYQSLGKSAESRYLAYQALFKSAVPEKTLVEIRAATNKAWVLGSDYFIEQIKQQVSRQVKPKERGGDRRSKDYLT
ncbi:MAG TPA: transposase [Gammaproteobacteria bacterium]|nr:transposase [Gammaproteobacteria bacterium]